MNARNIVAVVLAAVTGLALLYFGMSSRPVEPERQYKSAEVAPVWQPEVVEAMEYLALADRDGRVKSFHTFAWYELLRTRGYASMNVKMEDGTKRTWSPVAWTLDCLFYPEKAHEYPSFVVEDSEVVARLGISPKEKQRDRYTYNELLPGRDALLAEGRRLSGMETEKMSRIERLTNSLAINVFAYEALTKSLDFARTEITVPADVSEEPLKAAAGRSLPAGEVVALLVDTPAWKHLREKRQEAGPPPTWMETMLPQVDAALRIERDFHWFPPAEKGQDNWAGTTELVKALSEGGPHAASAAADLREVAALTALAKTDHAALQARLLAFAQNLTVRAKAVNAYGKTALDRSYLKLRILEWTKWYFIVLFLIAAVSWLRPKAHRFHAVIKWGAILGLIGIAAGIGQRVFITGWGPVTNIYETIPFITLLAGTFALLMGRVLKNAVPVSIAIAIGAGGLFLASRHEIGNSSDTMPALEAVLRSNLWLWTHVTSINIGYAVVLLASIFSMVYIFARLFDIMRTDAQLCRDLTRCGYGTLCFGLFFALIGTILGGIWGNDSWGRFWGWDPKENGAFLICLWCLFILHMRLAGWIKEFGFHIWNTLGCVPVIFAWWHVNQLQVGLHSYGFTEGLDTKLFIAYGVVLGIVGIGIAARIMEAIARRQMAAASRTLPAGDTAGAA